MIKFSWRQKLRYLFIQSRFKQWVVPLICSLPYSLSLLWLVHNGQLWIAQIMLAPILMTFLLAALSFTLAKLEFRKDLFK